ncbi:MAG: FAD-dependent thymidylate synthase [Candidatus Lokiarchaeota archaeon]|nr:FAD-dependent thymidylate synthase [Candidatus Lokiarchaeota archaeon]
MDDLNKFYSKPIDVLEDGKSFIRLIEYIGDDWSVVQSARVSFGQGRKNDEEDTRLIRYLMLHDHMSPFEHIVFKFHVVCPLFVRSQWFRHRTWSYNEISRRYTSKNIQFYIPDRFRKQDLTNKQGSVFSEEINNDIARNTVIKQSELALNAYDVLLEMGIAREHARMVLPQNMYTEFYATVNLRNLLHFVKLRITPEAQWEIRQYAKAILDILEETVPICLDAFKEKYELK